MSHTHWCQYHQFMPPRIWWQQTCVSLSCSLGIWSMINLVSIWRHWNITYLPTTFASVHIPYEGHLPPCPPISIWTFLCWCEVWHMHTQKCGNFEKTMRITSLHLHRFSCFRTCLSNITRASKWGFECDSPECRLNTKVKIIHLCWNKQLMYAIIIYYISSLQS